MRTICSTGSCGLSFMEQNAEGLFPHDLAREVLDADFRWRDPDGYLEMHRRIWRHLRHKLVAATGRARQRVFFDKLYLHRTSAIGVRYHHSRNAGKDLPATWQDRAIAPQSLTRCAATKALESARIVEHWLARQPEAFHVPRGANEDMLGLVASIVLPDASSDDADVDPSVRGAWAFARRRGPPLGRGDDSSSLPHVVRQLSADVAGHQPAGHARVVRAARASASRLGFIAFAYPEPMLPLMRYINFERAEETDFTVGGRRYTTFAHDWRVETFEMWWDQLCERSLSSEPVGAEAVPAQPPAVVVLSEPDFAASVRQALRDYTRPAALSSNPLTRSRLVSDGGANGARRRGAAAEALLRAALETVRHITEGRKVRARAPLHLLPAGDHAGGRRRAPRPALQYLSLSPGARHRADCRVAVEVGAGSLKVQKCEVRMP